MFYFRNKGTLPLLAITTLGISVKESEGAIGRFGTGLKYCIAGALRLGQEISIETGGKSYYFFSEPTEVRGKTFNLVKMQEVTAHHHGQVVRDLGFTTELGKHWQPWMYLRELYSNMRDEGGTFGWIEHASEPPPPLGPNETRIMCAGPLFNQVFKAQGEWLLSEYRRPVIEHPGCDLYEPASGKRGGSIFYQRILIGQFDKPALFDINIKGDFDGLTEDRTIVATYYANYRYKAAILEAGNEQHWQRFFTVDSNWQDGDVTLHSGDFHTAEGARRWLEEAHTHGKKLNQASEAVAKVLFRPKDDDLKFELSPTELEKFKRALSFLQKLGFNESVSWSFVDPRNPSLFGYVRNEQIYICKAAFERGTQFLVQVMIEEYLHKIKGVDDFTRELQDILFARLVSLGEELHGVL